MDDEKLWLLAQSDNRLLITTDKGFASHRDENHHGILIARLHQPNQERIHARLMAAFQQFTEDDWPGLTVVVRDNMQSVRRAG
jgi:uncharacterized protein with PIN domain